MENPFKKILHQEELPEALKKKVMGDVAMIKLTIEVADLFVVKYPKTIEDILDGISSTTQTKENNEETPDTLEE